MHHIELQLGADGKAGLLLVSADTTRQNFVGLWDWRAGVSVGNFPLPPKSLFDEDFRFLGPFIISSVMRDLVKKPEDELTVLHNRELNSSKFLHHNKSSICFHTSEIEAWHFRGCTPTVGDGVQHRHIRSLTHRARYLAVQAHL